ncbi:MAG TPA: response regulator, partial [Bacteroidales bacterium]|nr:response regulator [Bacteroidales bacterium]
MFKVVIIDDEQSAREVLSLQLARCCKQLELIGVADGVETGVTLITEKQPDVVLLDIHLSDGTGFDLLRKLDQIRFKLIFVTAYDHYALKAIKFSALDYLLKPIDPDEFDRAMKKALSTLESENQNLKLNAFFNNFKYISQEA